MGQPKEPGAPDMVVLLWPLVRVYREEPFIRSRREEPGFPPPICDDKEADGLLKSNTSPQSQRLSTG
ncbi:hypothetical protein NQZ68_033761 [Dissostichus eleginoides]|nr:hypothetical protein NQZ68_033761 [Dissostichus eleginoides]